MVGTTQLNGQVLDSLNGSIGKLTGDKRSLETTIGDLRGQVSSDEKVVDTVSDAAVAGVLAGQRVVLVSAPDAPTRMRDDLATLVEASGAIVTGKVALRPDLLDPTKSTALGQTVSRLPTLGSIAVAGSTPVEQAGQLLAEALVRPSGQEGPDADRAAAVVAGMQDAGLVAVDGSLKDVATLAVLLAGPATVSADPTGPAARSRAALTVARAFDDTGSGVVLDGPVTATADGGLLKALRDDATLAGRLSSVDGAERPPGRLATIFALREQLDGKSGQYGTGPGNSGPLPPTTAK